MPQDLFLEVRQHFPPSLVFARGGEEALREIFDRTLGQFMQQPAAQGLWEHQALRDLVFSVAAEIGADAQARANAASGGTSQPVGSGELYAAARSVMERRKDDCRGVIKPVNQQKSAMEIDKIVGGICPASFYKG